MKGSELDFWTGYANLALGSNDVARQSFERALFQNSTSYMALDGLGCCLALVGQHQEAIEKFSQSLALNPNYALGHLHLARSLEATGRGDQAMSEYREALTREPRCMLPEKEAIESLLRASTLTQ